MAEFFSRHIFEEFAQAKFQLFMIFIFRVIIISVDDSVISVKLSEIPWLSLYNFKGTSDGKL